MSVQIKKAVFPVAGMGTRFLPATKACPKEMLPVVDKPLIQYAVEEAIAAGITDLIFVTSWTKRPIEDHFDKNFELEYKLEEAGKKELLNTVRNILPKGVNCFYVRQQEALGLGHAVLCAKDIVGDEPFVVLLADDMIYCDETACLDTMINLANEDASSVVAVEQVPMEKVNKYGVIDPIDLSDRLYKLQGVVEKPPVEEAPSNLSIVGRYVLQPRIFELLENTQRGAGNEIQLTDAIAALLEEQAIYAYEFDGIRYDCGSKLGHMKANVEYALRHPELNGAFREYLKGIVS
ncbi:UTP--glucose-1-phosphate uridylyltransferase [Endozoicomonas montiporae]|uniref:UTP--glucose-1-phosphate uridylyltransferase n=2 Tax=Endozoicomonas montiporae TaxID=1027273 RepID=A0A081N1M2_9GAMM|nr:UTP--glucose-1-phosphate uridylyltransferase GalU [Endozoicomonas montiporae]AMO58723.1 UTP-glucose-1-phosphate uridylyltransferase [Endozoicomonas montiporae CL-33]KEQ12345.1 UTP--glucose-1-phosphate uridylyltransferase [Endozoicomonas montiporae]